MAAYLLHVDATAACPHQGRITLQTTNTRVFVDGHAVVRVDDLFTVAGCTYTLSTTPPKPQPCVTGRWLQPALRVFVTGSPAMLSVCSGICQSAEQIPQGPPSVSQTQIRVEGL